MDLTLTGQSPLEPKPRAPKFQSFLAIVWTFSALSAIAIALRFYARRLNTYIGRDDWTIFGAFILDLGLLASVAANTQLGHHLLEFSKIELQYSLKLILACVALYTASITTSKIAVLLMYARIFAVKSFVTLTHIVGIIVIVNGLVGLFVMLCLYHPIEAQWMPWIPHTSLNQRVVWSAFAIANMCLDFVILAMPLYQIWKLHQTKKSKIMLSMVFLVGSLVCVASILRIHYTWTLDVEDITYTITDAGLWVVIENNLAIVCACLPTFPNLIRHWFGSTALWGAATRTGGSSKRRKGSKDNILVRKREMGYANLETGRAQSLTTSNTHARTTSDDIESDCNGTETAQEVSLPPLNKVYTIRRQQENVIDRSPKPRAYELSGNAIDGPISISHNIRDIEMTPYYFGGAEHGNDW